MPPKQINWMSFMKRLSFVKPVALTIYLGKEPKVCGNYEFINWRETMIMKLPKRFTTTKACFKQSIRVPDDLRGTESKHLIFVDYFIYNCSSWMHKYIRWSDHCSPFAVWHLSEIGIDKQKQLIRIHT